MGSQEPRVSPHLSSETTLWELWEEPSRSGVCETNTYGEITDVEKPDDPPSNLVMTGFYTFPLEIFNVCRLGRPSTREEYELSETINLLRQRGYTIDAIGLEGWRIDVGYPEDRDDAEPPGTPG